MAEHSLSEARRHGVDKGGQMTGTEWREIANAGFQQTKRAMGEAS